MKKQIYDWLASYIVEHGKRWVEATEETYSVEWIPFGWFVFGAYFHFGVGSYSNSLVIGLFDLTLFSFVESKALQ